MNLFEVYKLWDIEPVRGLDTTLWDKNGEVYTVGTAARPEGGTIETVLTVYEGKYLALARAIRNVSDHIIGLVNYFDAE